MRWEKVTIIGVGLLGGSLGKALRDYRLATRVTGLVRSARTAEACIQAGAVDDTTADPAAAVDGAEIVVLCTPIAQMLPLAERLAPALKRGALVTDVGSVKAGVVRDLEPVIRWAGAEFVGSHPMAGGEKMGVSASRSDLFAGAVCVVTPSATSPGEFVERTENFWQSVGGIPLRLPPEDHDELVSRSSHLPHVLASTLAAYVLDPAHPVHQANLCAKGFGDTTRVASGSPEMWRDIALANRGHLTRAMDDLMARLAAVREKVAAGDAEALHTFFAEAKQRRDEWGDHTSGTPE